MNKMQQVKLILCTALISFNINLSAQDISQPVSQDTFTRAIGIDATFVNNFLPLSNNIGFSSTYLLYYIEYETPNSFKRRAIDIDFDNEFVKNESNTNDLFSNAFEIEYSVGKGRKKRIFKNCDLHYGRESIAHFNFLRRESLLIDNNAEETKNVNTNNSLILGIGPYAGIEYFLTPRLSLYTEGAIKVLATIDLRKFKSEARPDDNFKDWSVSLGDNVLFPRTLILFYYF